MPLTHLLLPQIQRRAEALAQEVEAQRQAESWVAQKRAGYLQGRPTTPPEQLDQWDAYNRQKYRTFLQQRPSAAPAAGAVPGYLSPGDVGAGKKPMTASEKAQEGLRAREPQRLDTIMRNAAELAAAKAQLRADELRLLPNAPATPALGEPVAFTENGAPIYEDAGRPMRGNVVIPMRGEGAMDEMGRPVDRRGRPTGYLGGMQLGAPVDPGHAFKFGGARGEEYLEQRFGKDLKAMQENRDAQGMPTDKLPAGYFDALGRERGKPLTAKEKQDILIGVEALRKIERGRRI